MFLKIAMLIIFFAIMIAIGFWCRKNSTDVNGFVLGGRSVGPWVSAFAYGTSYFSPIRSAAISIPSFSSVRRRPTRLMVAVEAPVASEISW